MKLLFLAPQPFFQERGTPIAVRLALEVLSQRKDIEIDLVTYHEGVDIPIPHVTVHRTPRLSFLNGVRPGISLKKLLCDVLFFWTVFRLVLRNGGSSSYQLVHAVEESVFIALLLKLFFKIPYVYDMDSSLALQVTEKWWPIKILYPILSGFETLAIRKSLAVVPVCDALATLADARGSKETIILRDTSLLFPPKDPPTASLKDELQLSDDSVILLYVGNLETYQGIKLLLESFLAIAEDHPTAHLIIIGGSSEHIRYYRDLSSHIVDKQIHFLGPRPLEHLRFYIDQAHILVSPRSKGNNTPMKIYSYLHSGRAILATNIVSHTQVLDDTVAVLGEPNCDDFARAMSLIVRDQNLRVRIGEEAQKRAENLYTFEVFSTRLTAMYDRLTASLTLTQRRS